MKDRRWLDRTEGRAFASYLVSHHLLMRELDRQLRRDSGLTHTDYAMLVQLADQGTVRITQLATLMNHSQSRISHAVARLERDGLVRRSSHTSDRRVVHVALTDAGRSVLEAASPGHVQCVRDSLFDHLTRDQVDQLQGICDVMLENLTAGRWDARALPDPFALDDLRISGPTDDTAVSD